MTGRDSRHRALDFKQPRVQHRWTQEERMLLCCLRRFFDIHYKEITKIFNHLYEVKIRSEGFQNGLPRSTIVIQWEDLRRKRHGDWIQVHEDIIFEDGPSFFLHLFKKIRSAAQHLHIPLVARARDLVIVPPERSTHVERRTTQSTRDILTVQSSSITSSHNSLHTSSIDQHRHESDIAITSSESIARIRTYSLNATGAKTHVEPSEIPNLLWRFSNDDSMGINHRSGFIANAFINDIGKIPSPEERQQEFPLWVESHVRPRKIPTPFISTSIDPLIPIHRAITKGNNAFVSIIDPSQINPQHIFYMKSLMEKFNIRTPGYRGAKEYVIWGTICRAAIVASFTTEKLSSIADSHHDIKAVLQLDTISESPNTKWQLHKKLAGSTLQSEFAAGKAIGKLLRLVQIQQEYVEDISKALNSSWSFTRTDDIVQFLRGVREGYQVIVAAPLSSSHAQQETVSQNLEESNHNILNDSSEEQPDQDMEDYIIIDNLHHENLDDLSEELIDQDLQDIQEDYIIIDHPHHENPMVNDRTNQAQQLRQSMERCNIQNEGEGATIAESSPVIARTVARRNISLFNPESRSWISATATRSSTPLERPLRSIEVDDDDYDDDDEEEEDEDGDNDVKSSVLPEMSGPRSQPVEDKGSTVKTPTKKRNHTRSDSTDSESTLGRPTPTRHRFSEERSHVNRILGHDWSSFWDQMHNLN